MRTIDLHTGKAISEAERMAPLIAALGNFDGVHLGHAALAETALRRRAELPNAAAAVWTFTEHPFHNEISYLTEMEEKLALFAAMGLDYAILADFDAIREYSPEQFVNAILIDRLRCVTAVCGFNFHFGSGGAGTPALLARLMEGRGGSCITVPAVMAEGAPVSSTRIRALIAAGEMEKAARLLGRPFSIHFPVAHGNRIGHTIGVPTINQSFTPRHIIPAYGVYCCMCDVGGIRYKGVSNVGMRPTVSEESKKTLCETHIIGYDGDLYGEAIRVSFYKMLRPEQRFHGLDDLKRQIRADIAAAEHYFADLKTNESDG